MDTYNCITTLKTTLEEIGNSLKKKKFDMSASHIEQVRNDYCRLVWLKATLESLQSQVEEVHRSFAKFADRLVEKEKKEFAGTDLPSPSGKGWDMWNFGLADYIDLPEELKTVGVPWADWDRFTQAKQQILGMRMLGYPNLQDEGPIKQISRQPSPEIAAAIPDQLNEVNLKLFKDESVTFENINIVTNLKQIQPMFSYYEGDGAHPPGLYCCLTKGVVIEVPKMIVLSENGKNNRFQTEKCKHGSNCNNARCIYVHPGCDFHKIGTVARCPPCPQFGNLHSLLDDLDKVNFNDIRLIIAYGLNDLISSLLWIQKNQYHRGYQVWNQIAVCNEEDQDD